jgi:hypothetical protein
MECDVLARLVLWRLIALAAVAVALSVIAWALDGGVGGLLRGAAATEPWSALGQKVAALWQVAPVAGMPLLRLLIAIAALVLAPLLWLRWAARRRRRYVRLRVVAYRTDECSGEGIAAMFESLHKQLLRRRWERALRGQPSLALEAHRSAAGVKGGTAGQAWLAVSCLAGSERAVEAALRGAYPNCRLEHARVSLGSPPAMVRLRKRGEFIKRTKALDRYEHERSPAMNRLLTVMATCAGPAYVQLALTPAPSSFERRAEAAYKHHERRTSPHELTLVAAARRSLYDEVELKGGLSIQHRPLFFADLRVVAPDRAQARRIASELRAQSAENRLVERTSTLGRGPLRIYDRRLARGEGAPVPPFHTGIYAPGELACLWHLPAVDFGAVPFARGSVPVAPAAPSIHRPSEGAGLLRDALGPVSIHEQCRRANVAVPGAVEQGKTSLLVASAAEDLRRSRCAVIVLDPKGDAAEATVSAVPRKRTCTLLDFASPTCGFNPLAASAPPDVVADYVIGALRNLFADADIRASSDRYLRNAIIAVLANDPRATLWDAARLLSVGREGYDYRARVGANVRAMPEFKEISEFFTAELSTQLADARGTTTAKLDAPVNKLARLLNSASIKRVLLNRHLVVDFDQIISGCEVLVVKGALGMMGAGNTAVLMQMLLGMLDAALARQQDRTPPQQRVAVALKIDEAPLVINRGFAETLALKRSAGLETLACWQTDSQWIEREIRDQLDGLFAHRIYFATASTGDARAAASLMMAEFSDSVRPGIKNLSTLGRPDARLHLPKHHAIVSLVTPHGRERPFQAQTIPLQVDRQRIAFHAQRQLERGGRYLADLRQPHWDRGWAAVAGASPPHAGAARAHGAAADPADPVSDGAGAPISYRELVALDGTSRVRVVAAREPCSRCEPEAIDLAILALVAAMRFVLSTQIHGRFNRTRAPTTTQRRLKRLADAELLSRLQFHRRDGAGTPMCYAITRAGLAALMSAESKTAAGKREGEPEPPSLPGSSEDRAAIAQVCRDLHVTGWVLALERAVGRGLLRLSGPHESVISPIARTEQAGPRVLSIHDLRLPGGRAPHDFWRTDARGERCAVERFETVRPDATIELPARTDLLVEYDDRLPAGAAARKLERYDHMISGWATHTRRYGERVGALPLVVFVCRDRARARECARRADRVLLACQAYAGEYPTDWDYPGRRHVLFAAERDAHAGMLGAYGVPALPPEVRASAAREDPRARVCEPELRELAAAAPHRERGGAAREPEQECWPRASNQSADGTLGHDHRSGARA